MNKAISHILSSPSHALLGAWVAALAFALGCAAN